MAAVGFLCIAYFFAVCIYIRRWDSAFPRVWLVLGILSLLWSVWESRMPGWLHKGITISAAVFLLVFILVECRIGAAMSGKRRQASCEYLIVLGAKVDGFALTDALRARLDQAVLFLEKFPETRVIVSGGQGKGEYVTEASAMAEYLIRCGVACDKIFMEAHSATTRENLIMSGQVIRKERELLGNPVERLSAVSVGIVTNNFHIYRACEIAAQTGYGKVTAVPAYTAWIMLPNYMAREFFAVCKMVLERKRKELTNRAFVI